MTWDSKLVDGAISYHVRCGTRRNYTSHTPVARPTQWTMLMDSDEGHGAGKTKVKARCGIRYSMKVVSFVLHYFPTSLGKLTTTRCFGQVPTVSGQPNPSL